uniref:Aminopeptidase n=1 Tax=Clastoptera arizonana TaxID=38151 RepID=A0A1B6DXW3_9HEMI
MELYSLILSCGVVFSCVWCYDFNLPNNTEPISYDLKIIPDLKNNTFLGYIHITFSVTEPTNQIVLNARNLTINETDIDIICLGFLVQEVNVNSTEFDVNNALLIIHTIEEMQQNNYLLKINYTGIIQEEMAGFSITTYNVNGTERYIAVTHFEPTHARSVFPCYDEPRYRSQFSLEVVVPMSYSVLSNVPVSRIGADPRSFYFQGGSNMPTYLLAWAIYDQETYFNMSSNVSGIVINTWARQGLLDQVAYANSISSTILTTMWSYLNKPITSRKIDQVSVPDFFVGAKENWGLITYAEESLLSKSSAATSKTIQKTTLLIAHELVHQWFGDMISVQSWSYPWLKEGFSQYFQYNITSTINPSWQLMDQIVVDLIQPALEVDSENKHALNNYGLSSEKEIRVMFDDISYNKGAAIIRMVRNVIGEDVFKIALQLYFSKHNGAAVNPEKLWSCFQTAAASRKLDIAKGLSANLAGWADNPGHPLLYISKTDDNKYNITQKRFLYNSTEESSWWIPLTFMTQNGVVNKMYLPGDHILLANISGSEGGWILFNINQTGFYRVLYDEENWLRLKQQLKTDLTKIPRINRAQLIDDLFNFARGGYIMYNEALSFSLYLQNEVDYIPWVSTLRNFDFLLKRFYGQPVYGVLKDHILNLMKNVILNVGFEEVPVDNHIQSLKQMLVLEKACYLGHQGCISKATEIFKNWKNGGSVNQNILSALMCTAVQYGSSEDWDYVYKQYLLSTVPLQKSYLLYSLTCSENVTKLEEFLDSIIANTSILSSKDFTAVINSLSSRPSTAVILFNYLLNRDYCKKTLSLRSDYEEEVLINVLTQLLPQLSSKEDILKLEKFNNGTCITNASEHQIKSLVSDGYKTIEWQEQYHSSLLTWFREQETSTPSPSISTSKPISSGVSQIVAQYSIFLCIFIIFLYKPIIYN